MGYALKNAGIFRRIRRLGAAAAAAFALCVCALPAHADPKNISPALAAMDEIVKSAPTLRAFLDNRDLRDQLFPMLSAYFGGPEKFSRDSYDTILRQLDQLERDIPGFGDQIWKPREAKAPFTVEFQRAPGGGEIVTIDQGAWLKRLGQILEKHKKGAARFLDIKDPAERADAVANLTRQVAERIDRFHRDIYSPESRREIAKKFPMKVDADKYIRELKEKFLKDLGKEGGDAHALVSFAIHRRMTTEAASDALRNGDPASVLKELKAIQDGFTGLFDGPGFNQVAGSVKALSPFARDMVPNGRKLEANQALFRKTVAGEVERVMFYDVHRPFYAVFRGVSINECVGGGCNFLESTNPARHSVPALAGAEFRFGEHARGYGGFTEAVPVLSGKGEKYFSTILGYPGFKEEVFPPGSAGPAAQSVPLFDLWLAEANQRTSHPFVVGHSSSGDNAKVLATVRSSLAYQMGAVVDDSKAFTHVPENRDLVTAIARNSNGKFTYGSRGQLVIDAMLPDAGDLTALRTITVAEFDEVLRKMTPKAQLEFLKKAASYSISDKQRRYRNIRFLFDSPDEALRREAATWIFESRVPDKAVLKFLDDEAKAGRILPEHSNRLFAVLVKDPSVSPAMFQNFVENISQISSEFWNDMIEKGNISPEVIDRKLGAGAEEFWRPADGKWTEKQTSRLTWFSLHCQRSGMSVDPCLRLAALWTKSSDLESHVQAFQLLRNVKQLEALPTASILKVALAGRMAPDTTRKDMLLLLRAREVPREELEPALQILIEHDDFMRGHAERLRIEKGYFELREFPEIARQIAAQSKLNSNDWSGVGTGLYRRPGIEAEVVRLLEDPATPPADRAAMVSFLWSTNGPHDERIYQALVAAAPRLSREEGKRAVEFISFASGRAPSDAEKKLFLEYFFEGEPSHTLSQSIRRIRSLPDASWLEPLLKAVPWEQKPDIKVVWHLFALAKEILPPEKQVVVEAKLYEFLASSDGYRALLQATTDPKAMGEQVFRRALALMDHPNDVVAASALQFLARRDGDGKRYRESFALPWSTLDRHQALLARRPSPEVQRWTFEYLDKVFEESRDRPLPKAIETELAEVLYSGRDPKTLAAALKLIMTNARPTMDFAKRLVALVETPGDMRVRGFALNVLMERYATHPEAIEFAYRIGGSRFVPENMQLNVLNLLRAVIAHNPASVIDRTRIEAASANISRWGYNYPKLGPDLLAYYDKAADLLRTYNDKAAALPPGKTLMDGTSFGASQVRGDWQAASPPPASADAAHSVVLDERTSVRSAPHAGGVAAGACAWFRKFAAAAKKSLKLP